MDPLASRRRTGLTAGAIAITTEPFGSDAAQWVVAEAERELVARYGFLDDSEYGLSAAEFDPPAGAFLVVRPGADGPAVGGVGLRPAAPGTGEVKRLWVQGEWRGLGIARALMGRLEIMAATMGYAALRLGTGSLQPEALALYSGAGWDREDEHWDGGPIQCGAILFTKSLL